MSFLGMDPPRQKRLRSLVSRGFTPRRVARAAAADPAAHRPLPRPSAWRWASFDWIADFAGKLPMDVISEMMGVPEADRDEVRRLADLLVHREDGVHDVPPAGIEAALRLVGYYATWSTQRRRQPTDDLTTALLDGRGRRRPAHRRGDHRVPLPDGRRRQRDHHQAARPRALPPDPRTRTSATRSSTAPATRARRPVDRGDAALRHLEPDARAPPRSTTSSCTARSRRQGSKLLLCLGSANRDERVFYRPRRLRHPPRPGRARADPQLRRRPALLPRRQPGPARGPRRADRAGPRGSARSRSTTTAACGCTPSTCAASPPCRPGWTVR